jgi:hypothetical protein
MTKWLVPGGLAFVIGMGLVDIAASDPLSREPLDVLWMQKMTEGKSAVVQIDDSRTSVSEGRSPLSFESARGRPEEAALSDHRISVMRLGEGFWRNGGWVLKGGLLARAGDGPSTIELYGKAVVHRQSYFAFPFHRDPPHDTGYEFFLLHRKAGVTRATIINQWIFRPDDVIVESSPHGGTEENVRGMLRYEPTSRIAIITITGLKRPFEERVDLSSAIESAERK